MPVYDFTFPEAAAGAAVRVRDSSGTIVNEGYVSRSVTEGEVTYSVALGTGDYDATVQPEVDVADASGVDQGVGADETAYFVATGPVYLSTDASGTEGNLNFIADARHGDLPAWASVVSGDIVLTDDAGTVAFSFVGEATFDFSGTTPQAGTGNIDAGFGVSIDGADYNPDSPVTAVGDGEDLQTTPATRIGGVRAGTNVIGTCFPIADEVADGEATPRVALTITRIAQAAVLPE